MQDTAGGPGLEAKARERATSGDEVRRDDGGADVAGEAFLASPVYPLEAEATLQERNPALDAGAEVPQLAVHPMALDHVEDVEASLPGEAHVLDAEFPLPALEPPT